MKDKTKKKTSQKPRKRTGLPCLSIDGSYLQFGFDNDRDVETIRMVMLINAVELRDSYNWNHQKEAYFETNFRNTIDIFVLSSVLVWKRFVCNFKRKTRSLNKIKDKLLPD